MKSTKFKESLKKRIRGWFPKEPKLPKSYYRNVSRKEKTSVLDKPISQLSPDTILSMVVGFLLILIGVVGFVFVDSALATLQTIAMFAPLAFTLGSLFAFWIVVLAIVIVVVLVKNHTLNKDFFQKNFTKRRIVPYFLAAAIIFLTYLVSESGVQFAYAIPITFVVGGVLVIKGLKRFAVTLPAFAVLLISILALGCVIAGPTTLTYTSENHFITPAQVPNIDAINITARSVEGGINLYFNDNSSEVCEIQFVKEYGIVTVGKGTQYNGPSTYDNEPASVFYYSISNNELYVIADSYTTLMNITVNENLIGNFSLYTYFGNIAVDIPSNVHTVQTLNTTSILGTVNVK